jgi:DASH complex subunit DAD2
MSFALLAWPPVSSKYPFPKPSTDLGTVKIPKSKEGEDTTERNLQKKAESELPLPQTFVRIPTEHAPMLQQPSSGSGGNADS